MVHQAQRAIEGRPGRLGTGDLEVHRTKRFTAAAGLVDAVPAILSGSCRTGNHKTRGQKTRGCGKAEAAASARSAARSAFERAAGELEQSAPQALRTLEEGFEDATTWSAGASWRLPDGVTRLHASAGTGVQAPTLIDQFGFFPGFFVGNPDLEPEFSRGFDIGIERSFGRGLVDVTYFRQELTDEIALTFDPATGLSSVANEDGESERQGVELTATVSPSDTVRFGGTASFIEGEVDVDGDGNLDEDLPTTRIPPMKLTGFIALEPTERLSLRTQFLYSGTQSNDSTAFGGGNEIEDYATIDLLASYDTGFGEVSAGLTNLLNAAYLPVLNQAYNFQFSNVQAPGQRLSLTYRTRF